MLMFCRMEKIYGMDVPCGCRDYEQGSIQRRRNCWGRFFMSNVEWAGTIGLNNEVLGMKSPSSVRRERSRKEVPSGRTKCPSDQTWDLQWSPLTDFGETPRREHWSLECSDLQSISCRLYESHRL